MASYGLDWEITWHHMLYSSSKRLKVCPDSREGNSVKEFGGHILKSSVCHKLFTYLPHTQIVTAY